MAKLKGLGRGLDALLTASDVNISSLDSAPDSYQLLSIGQIKAGKYQPRRRFDKERLDELANSIKQNGVFQPIVVRKLGVDEYEIVAGERRWRASKLAGLLTIPSIIREFNDEEALAISLIENIQRQDLNVIEEAMGYRRLIDEFKLTHEELARVTAKSRSAITNTLRLLNLCDTVQEMLLMSEINMGHARALLPLTKPQQVELASEVVTKSLSTAEVERRVSKLLQTQIIETNDKFHLKNKDRDIVKLEEELGDKLGMQVSIRHGRSGGGKLTFNYGSIDELDTLLKLIK